MITRTARIETEADIATLARALFRVDLEAGGETLMRRAEMALLVANPSLRHDGELVPGRRILVPQVEGLTLTARVTDDDGSIGDPAVEALAGLGRIATGLGKARESARLKRNRLLEQATGREVRSIVRRDLGGQAAVLNGAVAATRRAQELEDRQLETLRAALDEAQRAFEAFVQRRPDRPGRTPVDDVNPNLGIRRSEG